MPSRAASAAIASALRGPCEAHLGDGEVEMLGHVATIDHGADLEGDLVLAAERVALFRGHRADLISAVSVNSRSWSRLRARSAASSRCGRR